MSSLDTFLTAHNSLSLLFGKVLSFLAKIDNFTVIEELSNYRCTIFNLKKMISSLEHQVTNSKLSEEEKEIIEKDTQRLLNSMNKVSKKKLSKKQNIIVNYPKVIDYIQNIIRKFISKENKLLLNDVLKCNLEGEIKTKKLPPITSSFFTNNKAESDVYKIQSCFL